MLLQYKSCPSSGSTHFNSSQSSAELNPESFNLAQFGIFWRSSYPAWHLPGFEGRSLVLSYLRASYSSPLQLFTVFFSSWDSASHFFLCPVHYFVALISVIRNPFRCIHIYYPKVGPSSLAAVRPGQSAPARFPTHCPVPATQ